MFVLFLAGISQACARPDAFRPTNANAPPSGGQNLPFHPGSDRSSDEAERPAVPLDQRPANGTPFPTASHFHGLPSGVLITVQLDHSFDVAKVRAGDSFAASLAAPITIGGGTVIEQGTPVTGLVESAQAAMSQPGFSANATLVRLTLNNIAIDGRSVSLKTSSLFARGTSFGSSGYQLRKGHLFTFRLVAPVTLADPNSVADRRYSASPK
jgi:hypothetical protein